MFSKKNIFASGLIIFVFLLCLLIGRQLLPPTSKSIKINNDHEPQNISSSKVNSILKLDREMLKWEEIGNLTEHEIRQLNTFEKRLPKLLSDRRSYYYALGINGDDESLRILIATLESSHKGQIFNSGELAAMQSAAHAIGMMAHKSDRAWEYLKTKGINPYHWRQFVMWECRDSIDEIGFMTAACISALGLSGRDDTLLFIESLMDFPLTTEGEETKAAANFEDSLVDAAFKDFRIKKHGFQTELNHYFERKSTFNDYLEWSAGDGKKWLDWGNRRKAFRGDAEIPFPTIKQ